jgi:hypothetical protein
VRRKARNGTLPALRLGGGPRAPLRFDSGELELWLRENQASPVPDDGLRQEQLRPRRSLARAPRDLSLEEVDLAGARGARGMLSLEQCGRIDDAPSFSSGAAGRINHFRGPAERRAAPPWRIAAWRREYGLRLMKARMDMEDCLGP